MERINPTTKEVSIPPITVEVTIVTEGMTIRAWAKPGESFTGQDLEIIKKYAELMQKIEGYFKN